MDYYNIFGEYVQTNENIETFADVVKSEEEQTSYLKRILSFEKEIKSGKVNNEIIRFRLGQFHKHKDKMSKDEIKNLKRITKEHVQKIDGMHLVGNLELGGIVKAHGFYLTNGKKMKEIVKVKKEGVVPVDKNGHIKLKGKGKNKKIIAHNEVHIINNKHKTHNPKGYGTHFNYKNQSLNYIRGKTEIRGELNHIDRSKGINISNPKNSNNTYGWGTHFNYRGTGKNYIRGTTELRGNTYIQGGNLCIGSTCINETQLKKIKRDLRIQN